MQQTKRLLAFCMTLLMIFSMFPTISFAKTEDYISDVSIVVEGGNVTVKVTPAEGHAQTENLYCIIYNAQEEEYSTVPTFTSSLDISPTSYQSAAFIAEDVAAWEEGQEAVELSVDKTYTDGTLMYGTTLRQYFIETINGLSWDDYKDKTDEDLINDDSIGMAPSNTWVAVAWTGVSGSAPDINGFPNVHTTTFTLNASGNIATPLAYDGGTVEGLTVGVEVTDKSVPAATGGSGTYTYSTTDQMPGGLTLNSDGSISGTPTTAGDTTIKVTASDGTDSIEKEVTIKVAAGPAAKPSITETDVTTDKFQGTITDGAKYMVLLASANAPTAGTGSWETATAQAVEVTGLTPNTDYKIYAYMPGDNTNTTDSDVVEHPFTTDMLPHTPSMFEIANGEYKGDVWSNADIAALIKPKNDVTGTTGTVSVTGVDPAGAKNAGDYTVTFSVTGTDDYAATTDLELPWSINPATLNIAVDSGVEVPKFYVGTEKSVESNFKVSGVPDGNTAALKDIYSIGYAADGTILTGSTATVKGAKEGQGSVKATLTLLDTTNYKLGTAEATLTVPVSGATAVSPTITVSDSVAYGDEITVTVTPDANGKSWSVVADNPDAVQLTSGTATDNTATGKTELKYRALTSSGSVKFTVTQAGNGAEWSQGSAEDTVNLTTKTLTVTGGNYTAEKTYDGDATIETSEAEGALALDGIVGSDEVILVVGGAAFDDKNASDGQTKTIKFTGLSLTGGKAAHYTLAANTYDKANAGTINKATLTGWDAASIGATAGKGYNGSGNDVPVTVTGTKTLTGVGTETFTIKLNDGKKVNFTGSDFASNYEYKLTANDFGFTANNGADLNNYNTLGDLTFNNGTINKGTITDINVNAITATYGDEAVTPGYTGSLPAGVTESDISYELVGADGYATIADGKVTLLKATPETDNPAKIKLTITNSNYNPYSVENTVTINKVQATIEAPAITSGVYAGVNYPLAGKATVVDANGTNISDKYTITYTLDGSVSGTTLNHANAGDITVKVTATPNDDVNYAAPADGTLSIKVTDGSAVKPQITVTENVTYGQVITVTVTPDANGGSWSVVADNPDAVRLDSGTATNNTAKVKTTLTYTAMTGTGTVKFTVTQAGDGGQYKQGEADDSVALSKITLDWNTDGVTVTDRPYTGSDEVEVKGILAVSGAINSEEPLAAGATMTGEMADANYSAQAKDVTVTIAGAALANGMDAKYTLPAATTFTKQVNIGKAAIELTATATKTYGGGTTMAVGEINDGNAVFSTGVNGESITLTGVGSAAYTQDGNVHGGNEITVTDAVFTGAENYSVTLKITESITAGTITGINVNAINATYGDEAVTPGYSGNLPAGVVAGDISYELVGAENYATMEGGKVKLTKPTPAAGNTAQIKLTITNGNYNTYTDTADVTIGKKTLSVKPAVAAFYVADATKDLSTVFTIAEDLTGLAAAPALSFAIVSGTAEASTSMGPDNKTLNFSAEDADIKLTVTAAGNDYYELAATEVEVDISSAPILAVEWGNREKTYDGNPANVTATAKTDANQENVGNITVEYYVNNAWTTDAPKDAGTYDVRATNGGTGTYSPATNKLTINKAELALTATATKPYGNGVTMTLAEINDGNAVFSTGVKSESVTLTGIGDAAYSEADKHDPTTITVTGATFTPGAGTDLNNYNITLKITESITAKGIALADAKVSKGYDGNDTFGASTVTGNTVNVDGVDVLVTITGGTYDAETVAATEFTISGYTLTVGGNATSNYTLTTEKVTGEISPITLNLSVTDLTKGYNGDDDLSEGNEDAILTALYDAGVIPADQNAAALTLDLSSLAYSKADAHTATNLTGAGSLTLSGSAAGNYKLGTVELLGAILAKEVAFEVSKKGFGTSIGTAIELTDGNSIRVTGGLNGADLSIDDDYTLAWAVTEQGGTGITLTGSQASAPTAKGTTKATVTATLTDSNYTFATGNTAVVELTITVADGFFTVAFDGNGADGGSMAALEGNAVGADVSLTPNAFTKENHVFKGWTYDPADTENLIADGATVALTRANGDPLQNDDTVTLHAVWAPTYVLTVNAGEGSEELTITVDGAPAESGDRFEAGAEVVVNVTTKTDEGFKFKKWTADGVSLTDATAAEQNFNMEAGDVTLNAVITADLTITPQTRINKNASQVKNLVVADFITSAAPMFTGDTVAKLFTAAPAMAEAGVFEGNGVTITFYTDNTYSAVASLNTLPTTAGTYYYTVEVEADTTDVPKTNYILQELPAEQGILTVTSSFTPNPGTPGTTGPIRPGMGGGGISRPTYTVTYTSGLNGVFAVGTDTTESVAPGAAPSAVPNVVANNGYKFLGWTKDGATIVDMAAESITQNTTYTALYAPYNFADADNHLHYMIGRGEGAFVPMGDLTRAEAATMLARMTPGFAEGSSYSDAGFTDVNAEHWAYQYINFAQAEGIINGYAAEDGSYYFDPDASVTRGEFSAMIVRFKNIVPVDGASIFGDTAGDWAEAYIVALVEAGIISGYEDGTFRPGQTINRAEATKIVNGAVGRTPDETVDLEAAGYQNKFYDVSVNDWYFHNVMEATLDHAIVDLH